MDKILAPSILAADFWNLGEAVSLAAQGGAQWVHVDVMDGHFVPNLTFGPAIVKSLRKHCGLFLDVHLMIEDAPAFAGPFIEAGADLITFHVEAVDAPKDFARRIRSLGAQAGVSIKPETPVSAIVGLLGEVDLVLVMTVNPGFSYQEMIPECVDKVRELRHLVGERLHIQVDGGVNGGTVETVAAAGANVIVAGGGVFAQPDIPAAARGMLGLLEAHYQPQGG